MTYSVTETPYSVSYQFTESGRTEGLGDLTLAQAEQTAHNLARLGDRVGNIEVRGPRGRDVTFEMAAFADEPTVGLDTGELTPHLPTHVALLTADPRRALQTAHAWASEALSDIRTGQVTR